VCLSCDFLPKSVHMAKNRKITSSEFAYLENLKPYTAENDYHDNKDMKYKLLDMVKVAFGDSWYNLKDATKQAIDYMCFLSAERGFFFASPEHIAKREKIGKSTVYNALKLLRDKGILFKANRTSKEHNGLGAPVHFFSVHPYFNHICEFLNVDWKAEKKADWKAEMSQNACGSKLEGEKIAPTYNIPNNLPLNHSNNIHTNVQDDTNLTDKVKSVVKKVIKGVPKLVNSLFATTLGDNLLNLWKKIRQAFYVVNKNKMLNRDDLIKVGVSTLRFLVKNSNFGKMTLDEMCAYVYTGALNAFYNIVASLFMEDMRVENGKHQYPTTDGGYVDTCAILSNENAYKPKKIVRTEMLPDWFIEMKEKEKSQVKQPESQEVDVDLEARRKALEERLRKYKEEKQEEDNQSKVEKLVNWIKQKVDSLDWAQYFVNTHIECVEKDKTVVFTASGYWSYTTIRDTFGEWLKKTVESIFGSEWGIVIENR
jgi:predicted transcriptional regulator